MTKRPDDSRLTDLELEIMEVIWELEPAPVTVRAVTDALEGRRDKPLAYTTVQTMMNILCRKEALESRPGPGRAHEYSALLSRDHARSSMTREFVRRLFGGRARPLVTHLLEEETLDRDELVRLRAWIDEQLDEPDSRASSERDEASVDPTTDPTSGRASDEEPRG